MAKISLSQQQISFEVLNMNEFLELVDDLQREPWQAPTLKEMDLARYTQNGLNPGADGFGFDALS